MIHVLNVMDKDHLNVLVVQVIVIIMDKANVFFLVMQDILQIISITYVINVIILVELV